MIRELNAIREAMVAENAAAKAWVAEDPANRMAFTVDVDAELKFLAESTTVATLDDYFSYRLWLEYLDSYKELYGHRPRWTNWSDHDESGWRDLHDVLRRERVSEKLRIREARLEKKLAKIRRKREEEAARLVEKSVINTVSVLPNPVLL